MLREERKWKRKKRRKKIELTKNLWTLTIVLEKWTIFIFGNKIKVQNDPAKFSDFKKSKSLLNETIDWKVDLRKKKKRKRKANVHWIFN